MCGKLGAGPVPQTSPTEPGDKQSVFQPMHKNTMPSGDFNRKKHQFWSGVGLITPIITKCDQGSFWCCTQPGFHVDYNNSMYCSSLSSLCSVIWVQILEENEPKTNYFSIKCLVEIQSTNSAPFLLQTEVTSLVKLQDS